MATQTSNKNTFTSEVNKRIVRVCFWDPQQRYGFINIPPAFIQELGLEDEVTAEIVTASDGRKGILLLRQQRQGTI